MTRTTRALDWRDVVIHLIVTLIGIFLAEFSEEGLIPLVMLASAVIFVLRWVIPLDFAERLLARQQEGERLLPGSDAAANR